MKDPPGTISPATTRLSSRRPPAHQSVSLRHSPPASRSHGRTAIAQQPMTLSSPNSASDKANPPSVSPKILSLSNRNSSGESSDAGKWFETTNNAAQQSNASFNDNDPPFFLRNSSSSETPPERYHVHGRMRSIMPYRPGLANMGTDGSSTEDFRSVIDDLTVANKKLKQKLRKYERQYDAHLEEDKLFEVRFHGLPDHKKKELEETLRKFASDLDDGANSGYPPISSYAPTLEQQKTASSTSRFAESGYASMSASGQNSLAPSNQASVHPENRHKFSKSAYKHQQQSIRSYLHDIPAGLLPKSNVPMTDKSKKKLVVRRLEQIFAGKRSAPGTHSQPLQQEEVAQSAANADRQEREATGQHFKPEGLRVARIMPDRSGRDDAIGPGEALQRNRPDLQIEEQDFAGAASPDQRPTRPLDLDLYRAQVPTENMDYIRHLGFTPPDMYSGAAPEEGHGWLYLNLLINMAQLHTLHVTPEYVKDALQEYSSHLELSRDGRKIRWRGGLDVTTQTSDSSSEHYSGNSPLDGSSPSKRLKTDHSRSTADVNDAEARAKRIARAQREKEQKQFAYTPMFFHKEDSEDEDDSYGFDVESSGNSLQPPQAAGNSSGFGSSAMPSRSSTNKNKREDGPMIFYTKAKFCTDLSGDRLGTALAINAYKPMTSHPLGTVAEESMSHGNASFLEGRGSLDATPMDVNSISGSGSALSDDILEFSPDPLQQDDGNDSPALIDLEASGIGGVHPEDNFSIHVRRTHTQAFPAEPHGRRSSGLYTKNIHDAIERGSPAVDSISPTNSHHIMTEQILSASRKSLPPSTLPPASFLPFDSTSSGDVDSDLGSDAESSSEEDSESGEGPATALQVAPQPIRDMFADDDESSEESDDSEDSDDGSIDLLATARQLDPNTVRVQEREYDAAVADRLAEEIVAGSSAATAGGGSGFNSPVDAMGNRVPKSQQKGSQSITSGSMSSRSQLKRARTSDSLTMKEKTRKSQKTEQ